MARRRNKAGKRNRERERKTAEYLAQGLAQHQAMIKAGYSPEYAISKGYKVVKRPYIQSIFTEACERILAKRKLKMEALIEPYFEGLQAPLVVKSTMEGIACVAKDPETQEVIPDHEIRMKAADRLVDLFGGKAKLDDQEEDRGPQRIFIRKWITKEEQHVHIHAHHITGISTGSAGDGSGDVQSPPRRSPEYDPGASATARGGHGESVPAEAGTAEHSAATGSDAAAPAQSTKPIVRRVSRPVGRRTILPDLHGPERPPTNNL